MQVASLHIMGRGDGRPAVDGLHVQRELDGCIPGLGGHMVLQSSSGAPATAATGSVDCLWQQRRNAHSSLPPGMESASG